MSAKTLCLHHGEKVLFGLSASLLVGYVTFGFVLAGPDPLVAGLRADLAAAEAKLAETTPPAGFQSLGDADVKWTWEVTASPHPVSACVGLWGPYVKPRVKPTFRADDEPVVVPTLLPPVLQEPAVEVGRVAVSWSRPKGCTAPLAGWRVMRRPGPGAAWQEIASPQLEETSFADVSVAADASYEYCIRAIPDGSAVKFDDHGRDSEVRSVQTPADVRLRLVCASGDLAQIEVSKHTGGAWKKQTFPVRVGEAIGKDLRGTIGGEVEPFATGCILVSLGEAMRIRKVKKTGQRLVNDPNQPSHQLLMPFEEWIEVPDPGQRAIYRDLRGNLQELWQ